MKIFSIYFLILFILPFFSFAQRTAIYTDPDILYKKGVTFFDNENYSGAQQFFNDYLNKIKTIPNNESSIFKINAQFFQAVCAKETGNPDAEKLLLYFIKCPESPLTNMAYYHLGNYYYFNKKYKDALEYFLKTDPEELTSKQIAFYKFQMGFCYFYSKDYDKAKSLFSEVRNIQNKYFYSSNYYYGYIAYQKKDYDEALQSFQKISGSQEYGKMVPYYIAQVYFNQKKYDEVIEYGSPLADNPKIKNNAEINYLVGQAFFNKNAFEKARPYLDYFVKNSTEVRKEDIYQLAYSQYRAGDFIHAINSFQQLTGYRDSISQNAFYNLADCYIQINRQQNAAAAFMEASKMDFDPFIKETALFNYGKVSFELGVHKTAIISLQDFLQKYPNSNLINEATELLTEIFFTTHNFKDALKVIESAQIKTSKIKIAEQKITYYRAIELLNSYKEDEAIKMFDKSLLQPLDLTIQSLCHYWKGEIYYDNKDYINAITSFNQFLTLAKTVKEFPDEISIATANYNLGYCYLKQKNYNEALNYFNRTISDNLQVLKIKILPDALLRIADCNFMLKNYNAATSGYNNVIENKYAGTDYAIFQKGILLGLQGHLEEKIQTLQIINSRYSGSIYADNAQYEIANTYLIQEKYQQAIPNFEKLVSRNKNNFSKKSLLKLGLIYFNINNKERSMNYYKQVISEYPKTSEAKEALTALKDIYIDKGDAGSYIEFMKQVPDANLTSSTEDSIIYQGAESEYKKGNCENAKKEFSTYLNRFPDGVFATSSYFYSAECYARAKDYTNAINNYESVLTRSTNIFTEKSLAQSAKICFFNLKDYQRAYDHYLKLSEVAEYKQNFTDAWKGLMRCGFQLKKYLESIDYANKILQSDQSQEEDKTEAFYYAAKSNYESENYDEAIKYFSKIQVSNEMSAEANYTIAKIYFLKNDFSSTEAYAMKVIHQDPSSENWVVKSFLLMADVNMKKGDAFQAKATLQSILDNYTEEGELLNEVKNKLKNITDEEEVVNKKQKMTKEQEKSKNDSLYLDVK